MFNICIGWGGGTNIWSITLYSNIFKCWIGQQNSLSIRKCSSGSKLLICHQINSTHHASPCFTIFKCNTCMHTYFRSSDKYLCCGSPCPREEGWKITYRIMTSLLDWSWQKSRVWQEMRWGFWYMGGLEPVINLIQADSRATQHHCLFSEGKFYDSNYGNKRWFLWLNVESIRAGKACREKRQVEPMTRQYS